MVKLKLRTNMANILLNPSRRARVKLTQKVVYVYALYLGGWCDSSDHQTSYSDEQLEFLDN